MDSHPPSEQAPRPADARRPWRQALGVVLGVLAGMAAVLAVLGAQVDALARSPEPLQAIAGDIPQDPRVQASVPSAVAEVVGERIEGQVPDALSGVATRLLAEAAGAVVSDERFSHAWTRTLEDGRSSWLQEIEALADSGAAPDPADLDADGLVDVHAGGLLAASAEILVDGLQDSLPAALVDTVPLDEALREQTDRLAQDPRMRVSLGVPHPDVVGHRTVHGVIQASAAWPWAVVAAALAGLAALMVAGPRRLGPVLLAAGLAALVSGGLLVWWMVAAFTPQGRPTVGSEQAGPELTALMRAVAQASADGVWNTLAAPTFGLFIGAGLCALAGVVVMAAARPRTRAA